MKHVMIKRDLYTFQDILTDLHNLFKDTDK